VYALQCLTGKAFKDKESSSGQGVTGADPKLKRRGCILKVQDPAKGGKKVTNSCLSPTCIKVDKIFIYSLIVQGRI